LEKIGCWAIEIVKRSEAAKDLEAIALKAFAKFEWISVDNFSTPGAAAHCRKMVRDIS